MGFKNCWTGSRSRSSTSHQDFVFCKLTLGCITQISLLRYAWFLFFVRGVYYPPNLSHLSLLEKSKRWIQSQYYGTGTRIIREDFEALLNRQMQTRNLDHIAVMELRLVGCWTDYFHSRYSTTYETLDLLLC